MVFSRSGRIAGIIAWVMSPRVATKADLVQKETYLRELARYVGLNPVLAEMCERLQIGRGAAIGPQLGWLRCRVGSTSIGCCQPLAPSASLRWIGMAKPNPHTLIQIGFTRRTISAEKGKSQSPCTGRAFAMAGTSSVVVVRRQTIRKGWRRNLLAHPTNKRGNPPETNDGILVTMEQEPQSPSPDGLTCLLNLGLAGDTNANDRAFAIVYAELGRSAQRQMRRGIDAANPEPDRSRQRGLHQAQRRNAASQ